MTRFSPARNNRRVIFQRHFLGHSVSRGRVALEFPSVSTNIRTLRLALPLASTTIVIATFENTSWRFVPYQRHMCIISATLQASLASCCLSYRGKHIRKRLSCSSGSTSQGRTIQSESIISKGRERGRERERERVGFGLCGRRFAPIWPI